MGFTEHMKNTYCICGECNQYVELTECRESGSEIIGQCEKCGATNAVDNPEMPKTTHIRRADGQPWQYGK
jgi:translation initiation factor 2 beta subunit (eIF-2beta)/eIF-5